MNCRGFTLLDSLVALVLLSLGMLGACAMLLGSMQVHAAALRELTALTLAQDMVERVRAHLQARAAPPPDLSWFAEGTPPLLPEQHVSVEFAPAIGPAAVDRYDITVRWRAPRDIAEQVISLHLPVAPVAG